MSRALCLGLLLVVAGCATWEVPPNASQIAGPYPGDFKKRVYESIEEVLFDAETARFKWIGKPQQMWGWKNPTGIGRRFYGWGVCFKVNAKNRMGGYVGYKPYFALLQPEQTLVGRSPDDLRPVNGCAWNS